MEIFLGIGSRPNSDSFQDCYHFGLRIYLVAFHAYHLGFYLRLAKKASASGGMAVKLT
jgi:hypothetical protein